MKDIKEKIAVMQAYAEGKEIEVKVEGGSEWVKATNPGWNWMIFDYRVKAEISIPKSWMEFCEKNDTVVDEFYFGSDGVVRKINKQIYRRLRADSTLLETSEDAEGLIALIKLKRLRDAWWGDWRPDYKSNVTKYTICQNCFNLEHNNGFEISPMTKYRTFLVFETKEMAEDFIECFNDLIEKAEMWL